MTEFTILPDEDDGEDHAPPPYGKPGRILVRILGAGDTGVYRWESEILDYDHDSGVFWINEGMGFDYWLDDVDFPGPGTYVVEGVRGEYIRGDRGWGEDDDEEWEHGEVRLATDEESRAECLGTVAREAQ